MSGAPALDIWLRRHALNAANSTAPGVILTPGTINTYLYDRLNPVQIVATNASTGATTDTYGVFGGLALDERFQSTDSNAALSGVFATDIQGSTEELKRTNNPATSLSDYNYPSFGSISTPSSQMGGNDPSYPNPFRYTGREASDNTGLYYNRARYYNPSWSRFVAEDPLQMAAGPNIYAYVGNDPLNQFDPLGLAPPCGTVVTGNPYVDATTNLLSDLALQALFQAGPGSGPVYGTIVHYDFGQLVNGLGRPDLFVEQSFDLSGLATYGLSGSIRTDVILGPSPLNPIAIYDLKTGSAILTQRRANSIMS